MAITSSSSNGPIPSNSLSSATTATVTSLTNGLQHQQEHTYLNQNNVPNGDWICFNFGKELYTYSYRGVKKVSRAMPRASVKFALVSTNDNVLDAYHGDAKKIIWRGEFYDKCWKDNRIDGKLIQFPLWRMQKKKTIFNLHKALIPVRFDFIGIPCRTKVFLLMNQLRQFMSPVTETW